MIENIGDTKEAHEVWTPDGESGWKVGSHGCKRITVYGEYGEMSWVPYIRIEMENGKIIHSAARHYEVVFRGGKVVE